MIILGTDNPRPGTGAKNQTHIEAISITVLQEMWILILDVSRGEDMELDAIYCVLTRARERQSPNGLFLLVCARAGATGWMSACRGVKRVTGTVHVGSLDMPDFP